jgi:anti-anti-sigma factor
MDIAIEPGADQNGRPLLTVSGAVDLQTRGELLRAGRQALATGSGALVLDLGAVSFVDSTGIGALIELGHDAADSGGGLVLRNPSKRVVRILEVTGLAEAWAVESTD